MSHWLNTFLGWTLAATLVVFGSGAILDELYSSEEEHGQESVEMASAELATTEIATTTESGNTEMASAGSGAMAVAAAVDLDAGKKTFKKCKSCHTLDKGGKKKVGPNLYGIVGKDIAAVDGFKYSTAMKDLGGQWTPERLDAFLTKPKKFVKGTKMSFPGLKKPGQRSNIIAYLNENSDSPVTLAAAMEPAPATPMEAPKEAEAPMEPEAPKEAEAPMEAEAPKETETPMAMAMTGDATKGKKVFKKCKSCHTIDEGGKKKVGPNLFGIVGKDIASTDGFRYSKAMKGLGGQWTAERLDAFLTKPKKFVKGTKMSFPGLKKEAQRADLIAYLKDNGG